MTNNRGLLIVYSGPSGVGKGTLVAPLCAERDMVFSVSVTTRSPRSDEAHGREYFFVPREEFEAMAAADELLEYACYNGNGYGTPRRFVDEALNAGRDVLLEIEVQGARQIRRRCPEAVFVFVMPPSLAVLEARLRGRGTETEEQIARRMAAAPGEIAGSAEYDYIIVNDCAEAARDRLRAVLEAAHMRGPRMKDFVDEVLRHDA